MDAARIISAGLAARTIAKANDTFRRRLNMGQLFSNGQPVDGRLVMTSGIAQLPARVQLAALRAVATFDTFTPANDPHGEHDFGSIEVGDTTVFWKFDYYDSDAMEFGAENPAAGCYRVLTVMLATEY